MMLDARPLQDYSGTMIEAREIIPGEWKPVEEAVLCFIRNSGTQSILLIHKKTGLGKGLINAPGGRIEPGETPMEAAVRETKEEVLLDVEDLHLAGDLFFQFMDGHSIRGYVFETTRWAGEPGQTIEADPFWCREDDIPYQRMWADDSWWIPHLLEGHKFRGRFIFDGEKMLSMSLDVEASEAERQNGGLPRGRGEGIRK